MVVPLARQADCAIEEFGRRCQLGHACFRALPAYAWEELDNLDEPEKSHLDQVILGRDSGFFIVCRAQRTDLPPLPDRRQPEKAIGHCCATRNGRSGVKPSPVLAPGRDAACLRNGD